MSTNVADEKHGVPELNASFTRIKCIVYMMTLTFGVITFYSIKLFVSAIKIRNHIGYYINLVSDGDGDIMPSLLAVPVLFFLLFDGFIAYLTYKAFDANEKPSLNTLMFYTIIGALVFILLLAIVIISVIVHAYAAHTSLHDGIVVAMNNYSSNVKYKVQMDSLQVELQCCGSKKYDEWYTIQWYDTSLYKYGAGDSSEGHTPFSCCSVKSLFPCIHHKIEVTGKAYLYTPEFNLSISTRGCYDIIRETKQKVGWEIVLSLLLYILFQCCLLVTFRFIQTGHSHLSKFTGSSTNYIIWLIGSRKQKEEVVKKLPPELPPIPPELMDNELENELENELDNDSPPPI